MGPVALPGESVWLRDGVRDGRCSGVDISVHDSHSGDVEAENRRTARIRTQPRQHSGRSQNNSRKVQTRAYTLPFRAIRRRSRDV